ncbi:MAG: hypothetical protein ACOZBW_07595 [Thermodesulfobacteriota bacterium]
MTNKARSVRIVFCGGCNAGYDRVAAAETIKRQLEEDSAFTVIDDGRPDIMVAVCGCPCACVDEKDFGSARMLRVTDADAGRDILTVLKKAGPSSVMPDSDPAHVMPDPDPASS